MQEGVSVEQIVMDGAGDDETPAALAELAVHEPRLIWRSEPDDGQSHALRKAYELSHGRWLGWLNVDEFYLPGALAKVRKVFLAHPEVDVVYGDFAEVDEDGRLQRLVAQHPFSGAVLRAAFCLPTCATFVRREVMPARLWDSACRSMMDWDWLLEIQGAGATFHHIPTLIAAFRRHSEQVSASAYAQSHEEFTLIRGRHGLAVTPGAVRARRVAGRVEHVARKAISGSYRREARAWLSRGRDLRWFNGAGFSSR